MVLMKHATEHKQDDRFGEYLCTRPTQTPSDKHFNSPSHTEMILMNHIGIREHCSREWIQPDSQDNDTLHYVAVD